MADETPGTPEIEKELIDAARSGDVQTLTTLLDRHPEKLHLRAEPYEWSLLHFAAQGGHLAAVDLLLTRGLDVNTRERGDNTYAMHWAAAAGHLDVVRRLADAGGDIVGRGDDHALEIIGWATCWKNYRTAVVDFLVSRGAQHNIFSAVAMNAADDVRRIVAAVPAALNSRLTRNDNHRTPLHHAVLNNRPDMVALLVDLGADLWRLMGIGVSTAVCDRARHRSRADGKDSEDDLAEMDSAVRGHRTPQASTLIRRARGARRLGDRAQLLAFQAGRRDRRRTHIMANVATQRR
jgi:ankyrin repeat protein